MSRVSTPLSPVLPRLASASSPAPPFHTSLTGYPTEPWVGPPPLPASSFLSAFTSATSGRWPDLWLLARVSKHVFAGNGPVWNLGEQVGQIGTSTAWQWLLVLTHGVTLGAEPYIQAIILHSLILAAFIAVLVWRWRAGSSSHWGVCFLFTVLLLIGSNVVIDYTSGGLENGLAHLLVAAVWAMSMRGVNPRWMAVVFGLAPLVRHDMAVLLAPVVLYFFWRLYVDTGGNRRELGLCLGIVAVPLLLSSVVAIILYGGPLPIAFHMRSETAFGADWLSYWESLLVIDPWGVFLLSVGSVVALLKGSPKEKALALGIVLYVAYVSVASASVSLSIGRVVSWCIVLGALLLSERLVAALMEDAKTRMFARRLWILCFGAVTVLFLLGSQLHTPLFPVYDPWVNAQVYFGPDAPKTPQRMDSRYWSQAMSLPFMLDKGMDGIHRDSTDYIWLEQMRSDWNDGYRTFAGSSSSHMYFLGPSWVATYHAPLGLVVADYHHPHLFDEYRGR